MKKPIAHGHARALVLGGASSLAMVMAGGLAHAQATPGQSAADASPVSEVVVTATRVVRDGFEAPTPTTVVGEAEIAARAPSNLADLVNTLPQFTPSVTPATTLITVGGGAGGANFLNLRNLGVNRTLVLLDGNRVVPSSIAGGVDLNLLPQGLVKRVDVVTGGASAAWGSDAVAGVVNFVLDRDFTGLKAEVQGGASFRGDAKNAKARVTAGAPFADGRGHVLFEAGYSHEGGIDHYSDRSWFTGSKIVANPAYVAGGSQPALLVANADLLAATPGGIILSGANAFTAFNAAGQTTAFDRGTPNGVFKLGGTPNDPSVGFQLLVPVDYGNLYFRTSYDLTSSITGYVEASYAQSESRGTTVVYPVFGTLVIRPDNAYLPSNLKGQSFALGKFFTSLGEPIPENDRDVGRAVLGLNGKLGTWRWNGYVQHGVSDVTNAVYNDPIAARVALAVDAVNAGGQIVCRSSLTSNNGCAPFSPFGTTPVSAQAIAYATGTSIQHVTIHQTVAAGSIQGEPFSLPAGPVSVAAGAEYRREDYGANADPLSVSGAYWVGNYKYGSGAYHLGEVFAELVAPILKDAPFAKSLDIDAAVRGTDYSTSGWVDTYKLGASWTVVDDLRFRATHSRDIRAPNLNDLYLGGQVNTAVFLDPQNGNVSGPAQQVISGNIGLDPEIATTNSFGVILRPRWLPGFSASIDYYEIDIEGAIASPAGQQIINNCAAGQTGYCAAVVRNAAGVITQVNVKPFNAASEKESGIDLEFAYTTALGRFGANLPGRLSIRSLGTNVRERSIRSLTGTSNLLGALSPAVNGPPKWRVFSSLTYDLGPSSTQLTHRYTSAGVYDNTYTTAPGRANSINTNTIKSASYFDLSERWRFRLAGHDAEAFGVIENLLDQDPPVAAIAGFMYPGTNAAYYDTIGRRFRVGLRVKY